MTIQTFYTYSIDNVPDRGLFIYETMDNWLKIVDDPDEQRYFFSIDEIEEELGVTLTLLKTVEKLKRKLN